MTRLHGCICKVLNRLTIFTLHSIIFVQFLYRFNWLIASFHRLRNKYSPTPKHFMVKTSNFKISHHNDKLELKNDSSPASFFLDNTSLTCTKSYSIFVKISSNQFCIQLKTISISFSFRFYYTLANTKIVSLLELFFLIIKKYISFTDK